MSAAGTLLGRWVGHGPLVVRRRVLARAGGRAPSRVTPVSNLRIAVVMLLVAETMFFSGLIGAYLVFRVGSRVWPPLDLPRLPLGVTWANTFVLLASGFTMLTALRAAQLGDASRVRRGVIATLALGTAFVSIQGAEWVRLVHHGLTLSAGSYGATFYMLIGAHAVHVLAGLLWVGFVGVYLRRSRADVDSSAIVEAAAIYWFFVCALWLVLFGMVYP